MKISKRIRKNFYIDKNVDDRIKLLASKEEVTYTTMINHLLNIILSYED